MDNFEVDMEEHASYLKIIQVSFLDNESLVTKDITGFKNCLGWICIVYS